VKKPSLGRRAVVLGLWRSPLAWATMAVAATVAIGTWHREGSGVLEVLAWAGLGFLGVAGIPMALGFALQWVLPAPRTAPVFGLLAVAITGALQVSTGGGGLAAEPLVAWVPWCLAALSVFLLFSFLTAGAKACRRWFPRRFTTVLADTPVTPSVKP
jgi:hypothetical protein